MSGLLKLPIGLKILKKYAVKGFTMQIKQN